MSNATFQHDTDVGGPLVSGRIGHDDGGILVGKVSRHLLDEHRRKMAAKLTIRV